MNSEQAPSDRSADTSGQTFLKSKNKLPDRRAAKLMLWARRHKLGGKAELLLAILAVSSAIATYFALFRNAGPLEATSGSTIQLLLQLNGILLIALVAILGRWFVRLWLARRSNAPGSRLHTKLTGSFIIIAVLPPIVMVIFSALFLEFGLQTWFSDKVRTTLNSSLGVAEAYMIEHRTAIEKDLAAISLAFNRLSPLQQQNNEALQKVAQSASSIRLLSELLIVEERNGEGSVLARVNQSLGLNTSRIEVELLERAKAGESVVVFSQGDDTVVGIIRLSSFFRPTFLYIARDVNPDVIGYLRATRSAVENYEQLEGKRSDFQLQFNVVFVIVALLILLAAIWLGLRFSSKLVTPISELVDASERIGLGDLTARVQNLPRSDELGTLSRAFNRMTDQLNSQRQDLVKANKTLEERRRFLEQLLEGVSAGVIGLTRSKIVFLSNAAACQQLGIQPAEFEYQILPERFPAFKTLLERVENEPQTITQGQVSIMIGDNERTLLVRIAATETANGQIEGYVVTFDDLTDQIAHQRTAAWADVARRVAHEIKNPLTPIQLSAERLRRKYQNEIKSDPAVFDRCTSTIIRQVGDLRRMVDEFSSFARMPSPTFKPTDIVDIVRQSVFLQHVGWPDIKFETRLPETPQIINCDGRLMGQAIVNIIKNAAESVTSRFEKNANTKDEKHEKGKIIIRMDVRGDVIKIQVTDNGRGLPQDQKARLMEPYVTTRQKGTGLGLAIVRKIMEDHGGTVRIEDNEEAGATATLIVGLANLERRVSENRIAAE